jgi:hypothetical protein
MVKTEFMKLYEELGNINEAITDIDLPSIETTAAEAKRLWQEVWDLERDLDKKITSAYTMNTEYKKLRAEYAELDSKYRELSKKYWVRHWFYDGDGNPEHDEEFIPSEYEKVKDQVKELNRLMNDISNKLEAIKTEAKNQFSADAELIKNKKAEMNRHKATNTELTTKLNQAYPEIKEEINKVVALLNSTPTNYDYELVDNWKPIEKLSYHNGRLIVTLYTQLDYGYVDIFDADDFDHSGELKDDVAVWKAEDLISESGAEAQEVVSAFSLEKAAEDGWYKIPGSDWELHDEPDYDIEKTPTFDYDYGSKGEFIVKAYLSLGKKVKK